MKTVTPVLEEKVRNPEEARILAAYRRMDWRHAEAALAFMENFAPVPFTPAPSLKVITGGRVS